jgi:hypothetical protein
MAKTLLTLVQNAVDELGSMQTPSFIIGNTDQNVKQFLALANREGKDFVDMSGAANGWSELRKTYTFNTVAGQETYALPSDFQYFLVNTIWDRAYRWQLLGGLDEQEWNVLKFGIQPTGPRSRFKIANNLIYINPIPATSVTDAISYSYVSNGWCNSASGAPQTQWTADTDTYALSEECFILGLKWRFLRAKGLDYSQEKETYDRMTERAISRSGSTRAIPLNASNDGMRLLNSANVPDTSFGA